MKITREENGRWKMESRSFCVHWLLDTLFRKKMRIRNVRSLVTRHVVVKVISTTNICNFHFLSTNQERL